MEPDAARDADWTAHAACRGKPDLFFAPHGERPQARVRRESAAREVCDSCPVLVPCRTAARANREHGFWGGESEDERAAAGFPVPAAAGPRRRFRQRTAC